MSIEMNLLGRIIVGLLGGALLIAAPLVSLRFHTALWLIIFLLGFLELSRLGRDDYTVTGSMALATLLSFGTYLFGEMTGIESMPVFLSIITVNLVAFLGDIFRRPGAAIAYSVVVALGVLAILDTARAAGGGYGLIYLFGVTWTVDIAAYAVGCAVGSHKLAPRISPGKTWEGAVGGLLAAIPAGWFLSGLAGLDPALGASLAAALGVMTEIGDLAESRVKRLAGVKDSGRILLGHGGILDRFDGLLANAPIFWVAFRFIGGG